MRFARLWILGLLIACGGSGVTAPSSIVGTWHMVTVNGKPMPFAALESDSSKIEITSGELILREGGGFTETLALRFTARGKVTSDDASGSGTYTVNGSAVTLVFTVDGETETTAGTWSGNTLTLIDSGPTTMVFQR